MIFQGTKKSKIKVERRGRKRGGRGKAAGGEGRFRNGKLGTSLTRNQMREGRRGELSGKKGSVGLNFG